MSTASIQPATLFSPFRLRSLELGNRVVVSPMCQYSAKEGVVQPWHAAHLGALARTNPGLVIMEATAVTPEGRISPTCAGLWSDAHGEAMCRMLADIRSYSATPIGVQLGHAGRKASTRKRWSGRRASGPLTEEEGAWPVVGPSALTYGEGWPVPYALDEVGLARIRQAWTDAVRRADQAGFDLVEIHAAHGYLLSSFFSPLSNRRDDDYGGDLERRMRFPLEVVKAVRAAWPETKPLGVRINGSDWCDGGSTVEDAVVFARALNGAGADYIVTSAGNVDPAMKLPALVPGYMADFAARVRRETGVATMAVGLIVDPHFADRLIRDGTADLVALGRAFLDDPNWMLHAAQAFGIEHPHERCYAYVKPRSWPGHTIAHPTLRSGNER